MPSLDDLYPSKWLKASDLKGQSYRMTIQNVTIEDIGDKDRKPVMWLKGAAKGIVLNRTNADSVGLVHGRDTDAWTGKEVEIYVQGVAFQGQTVPAIRMRGISQQPMSGAIGGPLGGAGPNQETQDHQAPLGSETGGDPRNDDGWPGPDT